MDQPPSLPPRPGEPRPPRAADSAEHRRPDPRGYWRANIRLILILLCVWAAVSYGCGILFIEPLNQFRIGNLPLGFWFAQQGSIYVFIVLIFIYATMMDRLDRRYGMRERKPRRAPHPPTRSLEEREHDEEREV